MIRRLILLLALFIPLASKAAMPRTEVPIAAVTLSDGARRYTIPITIGEAVLAAGVDTGSTGLRVLARAVPADASAHGEATSYGYTSGVRIDGRIVPLPVAIGALPSARIALQRIDRIGCLGGRSGCPGDRLAMSDYGLQGDGLKGEGFPAIIGLNMGENAARNPLIAIGAERWIVDLPRPGDPQPGRLIIDPSDAEIAGYTMLRRVAGADGARSGLHDAVAGCLVRTDTQARTCGPLIFDSGAPGLRVSLGGFTPWPQGTSGILVVGDGKTQLSLPFVTGRREQASNMIVEQIGANGVPHISAGLMPYFGWSVLYDAKAGLIGLKPRGPVRSGAG